MKFKISQPHLTKLPAWWKANNQAGKSGTYAGDQTQGEPGGFKNPLWWSLIQFCKCETCCCEKGILRTKHLLTAPQWPHNSAGVLVGINHGTGSNQDGVHHGI